MRKILFGIMTVLIGFGSNGCSSGKDIEVKKVQQIHKGRTSEAQVRQMFGEPTSVTYDYKHDRKTLVYSYTNSDGAKKALVNTGGAIASVVLGPLGLVGGAAASNSVQSRSEYKRLTVVISIKTKRVVDYDYTVNQGRTSSVGVGGSIGGL